MGHDDGETHDVPARVGADADWTFIATDTFHSCGLRGEGALWCWGRNAEGQLGVGSPDGELSSGDTERRATLTPMQ
jgi:alpha-tubulin suppressor-like RCC1 family protein